MNKWLIAALVLALVLGGYYMMTKTEREQPRVINLPPSVKSTSGIQGLISGVTDAANKAALGWVDGITRKVSGGE